MKNETLHIGLAKRLNVFLLAIVFFLAYRFAFHLVLADHIFGTEGKAWWNEFQSDSDQKVLDRFTTNKEYGIMSQLGSLGTMGEYRSQFGLSGWALATFAGLFTSDLASASNVMYSVTAALNAVFVSAVIALVNQKLGKPAAVAAGLFLLQPWPSAFLHSIYWSFWVKLLPTFYLSLALHKTSGNWRIWSTFTTLCGLSFLSGYEFGTLILFLNLAVSVYFSHAKQVSLLHEIKLLVLVTSSTIIGLGVAISIHLIQLTINLSGIQTSLGVIGEVVTKRTGLTNDVVPQVYIDSLTASPFQVLDLYLSMPLFNSPGNSGPLKYLTVFVLIVSCLILGLRRLRLESQQQDTTEIEAIFAAWIVSLLGPIGWFTLAKPHSYIHLHINFAIWYLFVIPIGAAIVSFLLLGNTPKKALKSNFVFISGASLALCAFFLIYAQLQTRA